MILLVFEWVRSWSAEMVGSQTQDTGSEANVDPDSLRRTRSQRARMFEHRQAEAQSQARRWSAALSSLFGQSTRQFRFVKVVRSPNNNLFGADITPCRHTMRLGPYFFSDCGSIKTFRPGVEDWGQWPRAMVLIHELVHYVSFHNFHEIWTATKDYKDQRSRQYVLSDDITIVEDMQVIIYRDAQARNFHHSISAYFGALLWT